MSYSIKCIHCQAVLKSPAPVPAGKKIKCPKCQQTFVVAAQPAPPTPVVEAAYSEDDEMAAAIAKLEAEQSAGKPVAAAPKAAPKPLVEVPEIDVPEIDEDLVEPDDPAPPAKTKKRRDDDDDDSSSRKKKKPKVEDDEDEEEDRPRAKKKPVVEDDEDDEPAPKKKRSRNDEDDDEEPRSKKKPSTRDDDEDEDEPRSRKKRSRDDDDDDDRPTPKKGKAKAGGSSMMLFGILGGGAALLLLCVGCGVVGYFVSGGLGAPDVVGRWENNDFIKLRYEFRSDGTGTMDTVIKVNFRYTQQGRRLTFQPTGIQGLGGIGDLKGDSGPSTQYLVTREGDTLILLDERKGGEIRLRKVP